jgi:drug/metabolite transporter (DMT)-like permease
MILTPRLALFLTLPPLLWAGNAVVGRIAIQDIGPLWLNTARWALALLLLLPLGWRALAGRTARLAIAQRWRYLAWLSLTGVGAYNALQEVTQHVGLTNQLIDV